MSWWIAGLVAISIAVAVSTVVVTRDGEPVSRVDSQSIADPAYRLVTRAEVDRTKPNSPDRAFLNYWSTLQFSSWVEALSYFDRELVRSIGAPLLLEALKSQQLAFRLAKPLIVRTYARQGKWVIRYLLRGIDDKVQPSAIQWQRTGSGWRIYYFPELDNMLRTAAQGRVQTDVDPLAPTPSKRAIRAGAEAARRQSAYIARAEADLYAPRPGTRTGARGPVR